MSRRRAIVTGGASGIGAALCGRLREGGYEVESLDLTTGFDVTRPEDWARVGAVDVACLNAGVLTGGADVAALTDEAYRRSVAVNVDGVVFGVRRLMHVMPPGSRILVTASLGGLTLVPDDPIYGLTKHAVVGFVRSVAPQLEEKGIAINALCPGWADTPLLDGDPRERLVGAGFPLLRAEDIAEAAWVALESGETGRAWVVQPGRPPLDFRFPNVPGARTPEGDSVPAPPWIA
ncbi:MAG: SDR family NAD(P)-dependent oxidoreductase [Gaiellaceae bacterium]